MKKLTASVLLVVVSSSFVLLDAQNRRNDTVKTGNIEEVVFVQPVTGRLKVRDEITSAQQIITAEQLNVAANPNAVSAIAGKASGVRINQTNNSVNSTQSIVIRTPRTITGSNEALVVIDNVISSATVLGQLPPDLIESINIIKGAAGAAIYGSQGVNGVVVVTTKRGTASGGLRVNFNSSVDIESVAFLPKRQRVYGQGWVGDKVNVENGAWGPAFTDPNFAGQILPYGVPLYDFNGDGVITVNPDDSSGSPDDPASVQSAFAPYGKDNVRDFFQNGSIYQNTLSISSGNRDGYFGMNLGSLEKEFVVADDKLSRYSILVKGGAKVNKWTFDGQVNYIRTRTTQADPTLYHDVLQVASDVPIEKFREFGDSNAYGWNIYYTSPYFRMRNIRSNSIRNYFNVIGGVGYDFNEHIKMTYKGNVNFTNLESSSFNNGYVTPPTYTGATINSVQSNYFEANSLSQNYYGDLLLNMTYDIATDLNLDVTLGHNYQDYRTKNNQAGGTGIQIPGLYTISNLSNPSQPSTLNNTRSHYNTHAFLGNIDLGYKKYLFLNLSGRYESTSLLVNRSTDNATGYFLPAVSASFVPTKAFNFGGDVLNYLKVTAAWQRTAGVSSITPYRLDPIAILGPGYPYDGSLSYVPQSSITDPNLNPEIIDKTEVGISFGLFKDRITFDGAVYMDKTTDLITFQQASATSGLAGQFKNLGDLEGKGIEMNLNLVPIKTTNVRWDVGVNFTSGHTTITKLADGAKEIALLSNAYSGVFAIEGEKFPVLKGTTYVRDDQGRIVVDATTGLPQVNSQLSVLGRLTPKYIVGFTTALRVKGFTLSATADYRTGHKFFSGTKNSLAFSGQLEESAAFDRTSPYIIPNSVYLQNGAYVANTNLPIYATTFNNTANPNYNPTNALIQHYGGPTFNTVGENFVLDATAFKIREVSLSYTFSKEMLGQSRINELTIGVQARNPFIKFAKENRNYDDPETGFEGNGGFAGYISGSAVQYPNLRTYGGSVSVTF